MKRLRAENPEKETEFQLLSRFCVEEGSAGCVPTAGWTFTVELAVDAEYSSVLDSIFRVP